MVDNLDRDAPGLWLVERTRRIAVFPRRTCTPRLRRTGSSIGERSFWCHSRALIVRPVRLSWARRRLRGRLWLARRLLGNRWPLTLIILFYDPLPSWRRLWPIWIRHL